MSYCEGLYTIKGSTLRSAPSSLCSSLPDELCAIRQFADEFALVHEFGGSDHKLRGSHRQLAFAAEAMADVLGHGMSRAVDRLVSIGEADSVLDRHPECIDNQTGLRRRCRLATLRGVTAAHVQYELHILSRLQGIEHLGVFRRGLIGSRQRANARDRKQGQQDRQSFAGNLHMLFSLDKYHSLRFSRCRARKLFGFLSANALTPVQKQPAAIRRKWL